MNIKNINNIYFLGIGGIGMSALARYYFALGKSISGYDRTHTILTNELEKEGMNIHFNEDVTAIPHEVLSDKEHTLIIYTPAIHIDHNEFNYFKKNNYVIKKRAEVLGIIANEKRAIAIAGTHGKTTVSTMTAFLLKNSDIDCSAFIGGINKNYNTNLLLSDKNDLIVLEADEFDRSFLQIHPFIAIITAIDTDHLDIYENKENLQDAFKKFISQIHRGGFLIIKKGIDIKYSLENNITVIEYSLNETSDAFAKKIKKENNRYIINIHTPNGEIEDLEIGMPGLINVENAVAAVTTAKLLGVDNKSLKKSLKNFKGIKRRFDIHVNNKKILYIDDYAHHPEEIKKTILSVKDMYPNKKITTIFQPHLFTRTRDLADGFAESLNLSDEIILTEIYPARELPISGVNSKLILDKIRNPNKYLCKKENIVDFLKEKNIEILLTLGAGDIDQLTEPIKQMLLKK